jgi:hypothetical protein
MGELRDFREVALAICSIADTDESRTLVVV